MIPENQIWHLGDNFNMSRILTYVKQKSLIDLLHIQWNNRREITDKKTNYLIIAKISFFVLAFCSHRILFVNCGKQEIRPIKVFMVPQELQKYLPCLPLLLTWNPSFFEQAGFLILILILNFMTRLCRVWNSLPQIPTSPELIFPTLLQ